MRDVIVNLTTADLFIAGYSTSWSDAECRRNFIAGLGDLDRNDKWIFRLTTATWLPRFKSGHERPVTSLGPNTVVRLEESISKEDHGSAAERGRESWAETYAPSSPGLPGLPYVPTGQGLHDTSGTGTDLAFLPRSVQSWTSAGSDLSRQTP